MKYVSVAEMVAIENEADTRGHNYNQMMELAGRGLAEIIEERYGKLEIRSALGLVGSGNNGGDTLVALCYLKDWGWKTTAYIVNQRPPDDPLLQRAKESGCDIHEFFNDENYLLLESAIQSNTVLLDGILGTGIRLPLRGGVKQVLTKVKEIIKARRPGIKVVAVDCPSGVDCDSGEAASEAIAADTTVTMAAVKQGLLKFPAFNLVGNLEFVGIGLPADLESYEKIKREVITRDWVQGYIPKRPLDAHKSTFGVVMVIAGSIPYSGSVILTGEAAFRSGAGWVTLAVPEPLHTSLAGSFLEATWLPLPHQDGWISEDAGKVVKESLDRIHTLIIGPGFGLQPTTGKFIDLFLKGSHGKFPTMVIDADGLKLLTEIPNWPERLPRNTILTPHPGEMAILTGNPITEIIGNRVMIAESYARKWDHVVVLKGAFTVIASPVGHTAIIPIATPALARAGTGDVLAGLIGGFRAQGLEAYEAAVVGVWVHAQAGLKAAEMHGNSASVLAGDVLRAIKDVMAQFSGKR